MCNQNEYLIDFTGGGPLDGASRTYHRLPPEGEEILITRRRSEQPRSHSYTFDAEEWKFRYRGQWRSLSLGKSSLRYRTFCEALRQLGQLQFSGAISAAESLEYQARIKEELTAHGRV